MEIYFFMQSNYLMNTDKYSYVQSTQSHSPQKTFYYKFINHFETLKVKEWREFIIMFVYLFVTT